MCLFPDVCSFILSALLLLLLMALFSSPHSFQNHSVGSRHLNVPLPCGMSCLIRECAAMERNVACTWMATDFPWEIINSFAWMLLLELWLESKVPPLLPWYRWLNDYFRCILADFALKVARQIRIPDNTPIVSIITQSIIVNAINGKFWMLHTRFNSFIARFSK